MTAKYDEAFFSENTLLLVYVVASTGTYRFAVDTITGDGTGLCVHIAETTHAEVVTDDMAGWFITVAVPDSAAATYTEFDAVLAEGRPPSHEDERGVRCAEFAAVQLSVAS